MHVGLEEHGNFSKFGVVALWEKTLDCVTVKLTLGLPSQFMPVPAMGLNYGGANHFCLGKLVLVVVFFSILIIAAGSRFGSMTSFKLIAFLEPEKGYLFL